MDGSKTYFIWRSCKWKNIGYAHKLFRRFQRDSWDDLGTPSQVLRSSEDTTMLNLDDHRTRKRNTPGDQSMRRTIQDLVSSIDPNVKIEPEVEDVSSFASSWKYF